MVQFLPVVAPTRQTHRNHNIDLQLKQPIHQMDRGLRELATVPTTIRVIATRRILAILLLI
jgi:hypothetical protein